MATDREIALEIAIAALLVAARHDKNEIAQRAEGLIFADTVQGGGASVDHKSVARSAIKEIAERV
ncbi:hypothetical protein [Pseudomonas sp. NUPR-001]|uniref:hypothetical protein n=1 Tax=Pseudomonas sp. NUPR-001 TaxID=3416058 RepID=UPI003F94CD03